MSLDFISTALLTQCSLCACISLDDGPGGTGGADTVVELASALAIALVGSVTTHKMQLLTATAATITTAALMTGGTLGGGVGVGGLNFLL